ncbi:UDP-N-acetylmuramoyl-tripeptide--D-alanyl-D-alanine ligase [Spirochaetia bacterium 38H-sp]|uniref:UDP-N-acetylmuramoyl-tripeptide--D-alanyl-D-alanine ligase n=1 Tax=Rarispira pelagica TaxID=3141764 RepID=A0ABU9UDE0_9SPIR
MDIIKISKIVSGKLYNISGSKLTVEDVVINSREAAPGKLFVPLKGKNTDGHFYIEEAFSKGAPCSLVDESFFRMAGAAILRYAATNRASFIVVSDTLSALQSIAEFYMSHINAPLRIGVSGSNGKTTTKEMLASVIKQEIGAIAYTKGNLNSEIGLPLSVLRMPKKSKCLILEMGVDHPGEMDRLVKIVRPNLAVITGIGTAHLGAFGTRENIALEKKKIFSYFGSSSTGLIPEDEDMFDLLKEGCSGNISKYGFLSTKGLQAWKDDGLNGVSLVWEGLEIRIPVPGRHIVKNALGVIKMAKTIGLSNKNIAAGLSEYRPLFGRWQVVKGDITVILDCYNSNPDSLKASLSTFSDIKSNVRKKIVVIGDMLELGDGEDRFHQEIGEYVSSLDIDVFIFVGQRMRLAFEKMGDTNMCFHFDSAEEARKTLEDISSSGDVILCKGSRAMELERTVKNIVEGAVNA